MANRVEVIGRKTGNFVAAKQTTAEQIAFSVVIPGGTLGTANELRINAQLSTVSLSRRPCTADSPPANNFIPQSGLFRANDQGSGNLRGSAAYVSPTEEIYMMVSDPGAPPGDPFARYYDDQYWLNRYMSATSDSNSARCGHVAPRSRAPKVPSLITRFGVHRVFPTEFGAGPGVPIGTSDEPSYMLTGGQDFSYFSIRANTEAFYSHPGGAGYDHFVTEWVKGGSAIYTLLNNTSEAYLGGTPNLIAKHASTGALQVVSSSLQSVGPGFTGSPKLTANYLYVLQSDHIGIGNPSQTNLIQRLDLMTLDLIDTIDLGTGLIAKAFVAVTDDFFYILDYGSGGDLNLWYWDGSLHLIANFLNGENVFNYNVSPFVDWNLFFDSRSGYLFLMTGGFSGYPIDIMRIGPMECR